MTSCCRAAFWLFIRAQHHRLFATWSRRYNHHFHLHRNTLWQRLRQKTARRFTTKTAARANRFSSATAGRWTATCGTDRVCRCADPPGPAQRRSAGVCEVAVIHQKRSLKALHLSGLQGLVHSRCSRTIFPVRPLPVWTCVTAVLPGSGRHGYGFKRLARHQYRIQTKHFPSYR